MVGEKKLKKFKKICRNKKEITREINLKSMFTIGLQRNQEKKYI